MNDLVFTKATLWYRAPGQHNPQRSIQPGKGGRNTAEITPLLRSALGNVFVGTRSESTTAKKSRRHYLSVQQYKFLGVLLSQEEALSAGPGDQVETCLDLVLKLMKTSKTNLYTCISRWSGDAIKIEGSKVVWKRGPGTWRIEPDFTERFQHPTSGTGASSDALSFDGSNHFKRCLLESEPGELDSHLRAILSDTAKRKGRHVLISVLGAKGGDIEDIVVSVLRLFGAKKDGATVSENEEDIARVLKLARRIRTIEVAILLESNNGVRIAAQLKTLIESLSLKVAPTDSIHLRLAIRKYRDTKTPTIRGTGVSILGSPFIGSSDEISSMQRAYIGPRRLSRSGYNLHIVGTVASEGDKWIECFRKEFSIEWRATQKTPDQVDQDVMADFDRTDVITFLEWVGSG